MSKIRDFGHFLETGHQKFLIFDILKGNRSDYLSVICMFWENFTMRLIRGLNETHGVIKSPKLNQYSPNLFLYNIIGPSDVLHYGK